MHMANWQKNQGSIMQSVYGLFLLPMSQILLKNLALVSFE